MYGTGGEDMTDEKTFKARMVKVALQTLPEFGVFSAAIAIMVLDVLVLKCACSETGLMEWCQFAAIMMAGCVMLAAAIRDKEGRAGVLLASAFFFDMAIREQDWLCDKLFHGCWVVPVAIITVLVLLNAWRRREEALKGLEALGKSPDFGELMIAILIIIGFSRMLGYKAIWRELTDGPYLPLAKRFVEEASELLGYLLVLNWTVKWFCRRR